MTTALRPLTNIVEYETQELSFRSMEILPDLLQTRAKLDVKVSKQYAAWMTEGASFPAVVVFLTPDGRFLLADGFHRVDAAKRIGERSIRAVIRPGTIEDAILFGVDANMGETKFNAPNSDDRMHACKIMIRNDTFRYWPDAEIARRCGVSSGSVRARRLELQEEGVPLPKKVRKFSHGKQIEGFRSYRSLDRSARPKRLWNALRKTAGLPSLNFKQWLRVRGINPRSRATGTLGGFFVGEAFIVHVEKPDADSVYRAVGFSLLSRVDCDEVRRVILVGFFDTRISRLASRLPDPIEFMTPDELVAEFGPKGDQ